MPIAIKCPKCGKSLPDSFPLCLSCIKKESKKKEKESKKEKDKK